MHEISIKSLLFRKLNAYKLTILWIKFMYTTQENSSKKLLSKSSCKKKPKRSCFITDQRFGIKYLNK